ncbi:hypothetical protein ACN077_26175, partial [Clostridium chromiireducens]|uniref:hypothetical protein n=1 Tax=Clostridium chromiireducens TaxID=225345 RepID=UPI003AF7A2BB
KVKLNLDEVYLQLNVSRTYTLKGHNVHIGKSLILAYSNKELLVYLNVFMLFCSIFKEQFFS